VAGKYTLFVNTEDCFGCSTCEVACKQEHGLPSGLRLIKVYSDSPRMIEGKYQLRYIVTHCIHCSQPPCKDVCTANAINKREDGIVLINEKLCTGCKDCIEACPLRVIFFDQEQEVAKKCDMCVDRIDQGLNPACVSTCPAYCIFLGKV
jgi:Fe-S-cluster-containing dehydrogenase component